MADRDKPRRIGRVAKIILWLAIAGAPLPFGSRDAITVAIWCFLLGLGLVLAPVRSLKRGHYAVLGGIGCIVICYCFVLHEQLAVHPWIAKPNPIWAKAAELLGEQIMPSVAIIRGQPFYALGAPLANVLALVLGIVVGADRATANRTVEVMAWAGAGYAAYGIGALLFAPTTILWREKIFNIESLTATFINRNTAAAYFGSCAAVWLVLLLQKVRGQLPAGPLTWSKLTLPDDSRGVGQREIVIRLAMFFLCLAAMFMTNSRGGTLVSLFAMVVAAVVFSARDLPRAVSVGGAVIAAGVVALALLQVLGGNVEARIDVGGLVEQGRLATYQSTLRIISDYPLFGTGLGTFAAILPAYRSGDISIVGVWNLAHSTPLELAAELGLPLTLVIAAGWIAALVLLVRGTRQSRRRTVAPLATLAVALISVVHSSIDFSLQVSGFAIVVFALLGVGLAQSLE